MITLVNGFRLHGDRAEFEREFVRTAEFMRRRPGFLGSHLVRSTSEENRYFNIAGWATREDFDAAIGTPEMREHREQVRRLATPEPHPCTTVYRAPEVSR